MVFIREDSWRLVDKINSWTETNYEGFYYTPSGFFMYASLPRVTLRAIGIVAPPWAFILNPFGVCSQFSFKIQMSSTLSHLAKLELYQGN